MAGRDAFERAAAWMARALLAWIAGRLHPSRRAWIEALRAELEVIAGGGRQLVWAAGGLRLAWIEWRAAMLRERRFWPSQPGTTPGICLGILLLIVILATRGVSDDAFPWLPFYGLFFLYLALAGSLAARRAGSIAAGARAGAVTAMVALCFALLAFGVAGPGDVARAIYVLLLFGAVGSVCGAGGALVGTQGRWRAR